MAEGIVFLDVDDEITSAASRIRSAPGTKVALVVPNGSRIATSRINFRLLSREALVSNRRLSVVAADPASRALAASAGLPVFATVAEYESALAGPRPAVVDDAEPIFQASDGTDEPVATPTPAAEPPRSPKRSSNTAGPGGAAGAAALGGAAPGGASGETVRMPVPVAPTPRTAEPPTPRTAEPPTRADTRPPVTPSRSRVRPAVVAAIAAIALAVVVAGAAAYLLLPSAAIAVTPRQESIEIPLTIAADPSVTEVDAANSTVPAIRLDVPVKASDTFTTTGRHVEQSTAGGSVTFENYNTGSSNTVPRGSIVSTEGGIRFRTQASVTLPPATLVPTTPVTVQPSRRNVAVTAMRAGPTGNVPANAIRVVPQGENPQLLKVNNSDPTSGGARTETPEVTKPEVDRAVAALNKTLATAFADAIKTGAGAPAGAELFPTTATPGTPTFTPDPSTLVGKAVDTFDLEVNAKGSVTAVDPSPVRSIAEARLEERIGADHHLVDGSMHIDVADGTVGEDGQVTFQATARAARVLVVDPDQLRALVKGRTAAEAAAALAPFGAAKVTLWPDWVTTVTGVDARLSIEVNEGGGGASAGPSAAPSSRGSPASRSSSPVASARPSRAAGSAAP